MLKIIFLSSKIANTWKKKMFHFCDKKFMFVYSSIDCICCLSNNLQASWTHLLWKSYRVFRVNTWKVPPEELSEVSVELQACNRWTTVPVLKTFVVFLRIAVFRSVPNDSFCKEYNPPNGNYIPQFFQK